MKKAVMAVVFALGALALTLLPLHMQWLKPLERATWGWRARTFAEKSKWTDHIVLILLDQQSLDWGKNENGLSWPWPRQVYAPVVDFCRRGGARILAFDVLFTEPSAYGVPDDEALAAAIERMPSMVGACLLSDETGERSRWPDSAPEPLIKGAVALPLTAGKGLFPIDELAAPCSALGDVAGLPDDDGVVRRAALAKRFNRRVVPGLGPAVYLQELKKEQTPPFLTDVTDRAISFATQSFPLDENGYAIIRYRGGAEVYRRLSAAAVIKSEMALQAGEPPQVDPSVVSNAFVLFGFSAPGLLDLRSLPTDPVAPGVVVHAAVLDNMLAGDFIRSVKTQTLYGVLFALALAAAAAVLYANGALVSGAAALLLLTLSGALSFFGYARGVAFPFVQPLFTTGLATAGALLYSYATEGRQKRFIKNAFKHYLSGDVIEALVRDPGRLKLGGEKRELSIFFSDLQGFTSISEKLEPEALTTVLNEYLTAMTDIILEEGGTLDKYEGDAIIAFWNAPVEQFDHADRACRAALKCQQCLDELRPDFKKRWDVELFMRVGVHTGPVVVGNMGSRERFDYTVLGDAANLASRLEGANKVFGTYTMISEHTRKAAMHPVPCRPLGALRVVGRGAPVQVHELLAEAMDPESLAQYARGLEALAEGAHEKAFRAFDALTGDSVAAKYAQLCRDVLSGRVTWDGVWNLDNK